MRYSQRLTRAAILCGALSVPAWGTAVCHGESADSAAIVSLPQLSRLSHPADASLATAAATGSTAFSDVTQPHAAADSDSAEVWWNSQVYGSVLPVRHWVSFDLSTVLVEALEHNPRIMALKHRSAIASEQIVQENAVFDPSVLLETRYGRTDDPVGNTLTTGGPDRLNESSWNNRAGVNKLTRQGSQINLSQHFGMLDSNSQFFSPTDQGNARLNLSLTKPLMAGSGQVYNERLIVQARIECRQSWQELLRETQLQLGKVMTAYWQLYEARCHLLQAIDARNRAQQIADVIEARHSFDSGRLELAKVRLRLARLGDVVVEAQRSVRHQQVVLVQVINSPTLQPGADLELIPTGLPVCDPLSVLAEDALVTGVNHRPEVRSAALDLDAAALAIRVSRNELLPQLDAVVSGYVSALRGEYAMGRAWEQQFDQVPGFSSGLVYERAYGNRAARSRVRSAHQRYMEMGQRYREAISITSAEIMLALQSLEAASTRLEIKQRILHQSIEQERLVHERWEEMGAEGRHAALVLEDLLEQLEMRTAAESEYVSNQVQFLISLVELQSAMGTLLLAEGVEPTMVGRGADPAPFPMPEADPLYIQAKQSQGEWRR